mmetsp:Transcript_17497/g.33824  ORF Transcript_17497/g.33824 Transcript_17497/m.33824 type:complete len:932 (-) Transcript_17497:736-3531(-)
MLRVNVSCNYTIEVVEDDGGTLSDEDGQLTYETDDDSAHSSSSSQFVQEAEEGEETEDNLHYYYDNTEASGYANASRNPDSGEENPWQRHTHTVSEYSEIWRSSPYDSQGGDDESEAYTVNSDAGYQENVDPYEEASTVRGTRHERRADEACYSQALLPYGMDREEHAEVARVAAEAERQADAAMDVEDEDGPYPDDENRNYYRETYTEHDTWTFVVDSQREREEHRWTSQLQTEELGRAQPRQYRHQQRSRQQMSLPGQMSYGQGEPELDLSRILPEDLLQEVEMRVREGVEAEARAAAAGHVHAQTSRGARLSNSNSSSHTSVRAPTYPQPLDYQASLPALHPHRIAREMLQAILEPVRFEQEEEVDEMEPPDFHQRFASNGQDRAYSSYARAHRGITPSDSTSRIQRGVGMRFGDDPSAASDLPHPEFSIHPALDVLRHSTHRNFSENTHSQPRSLPPEHHQNASRSGPSTDAPSTSSPFPSNILHMPHSRLLHSSFLSGNVPVPAQGYMPVQPPGIAPAGDKETLDDSLAECILGRSAGSAVYHIPCLPPEVEPPAEFGSTGNSTEDIFNSTAHGATPRVLHHPDDALQVSSVLPDITTPPLQPSNVLHHRNCAVPLLDPSSHLPILPKKNQVGRVHPHSFETPDKAGVALATTPSERSMDEALIDGVAEKQLNIASVMRTSNMQSLSSRDSMHPDARSQPVGVQSLAFCGGSSSVVSAAPLESGGSSSNKTDPHCSVQSSTSVSRRFNGKVKPPLPTSTRDLELAGGPGMLARKGVVLGSTVRATRGGSARRLPRLATQGECSSSGSVVVGGGSDINKLPPGSSPINLPPINRSRAGNMYSDSSRRQPSRNTALTSTVSQLGVDRRCALGMRPPLSGHLRHGETQVSMGMSALRASTMRLHPHIRSASGSTTVTATMNPRKTARGR